MQIAHKVTMLWRLMQLFASLLCVRACTTLCSLQCVVRQYVGTSETETSDLHITFAGHYLRAQYYAEVVSTPRSHL
jgi:hypothetical protein